MVDKMAFRGTVTQPSFNCQNPPHVQCGWAVQVEKYLYGEKTSPYPVGDNVGFAEGCFENSVDVGDEVLVEYTGDRTKYTRFVIRKL